MTGGNYFTWFKEDGAKERSLLYKLENMGVMRLQSKSGDMSEGTKHYDYKWRLTVKGQELVDNNKCLQDLWNDGKKINIIEFYNKIIEILKKKNSFKIDL